MEAYGGHEELVTRGIDPTRLLGMNEEKTNDEFAYKENEEEGSNKKGIIHACTSVMKSW